MPLLLDADGMRAALGRMADQILAEAPTDTALAIVGIRRRGASLADRLVRLLMARGVPEPLTGELDISLYRDDLSVIGPLAQVNGTQIDFDVEDCWLVLVDDVLYTGRSVAAALRAIHALGRPRAIRLAALVDRGHRELPIQADYAGLRTPTESYHIVKVKVAEIDGREEVELYDTR